MSDYRAMYFALFNEITDAIEILQKAQQQGERMFLATDEEGDCGTEINENNI